MFKSGMSAEEVQHLVGGRSHYNAIRRVQAEQRRRKALDLFIQGYLQVAIARYLGVSRSTISRDLARCGLTCGHLNRGRRTTQRSVFG